MTAAIPPLDLLVGAMATLAGVVTVAAVILSIRHHSRNAASGELRTLCRMLGLSAGDRRVLTRAAKACHEPSLHAAALTLSHGCFSHARMQAKLPPTDIVKLDALESQLFHATAPSQRTATKRTVVDRSEPQSTTAVRSAFSSTVR